MNKLLDNLLNCSRRKLFFVATCVGEGWKNGIADDATELAQMVENGEEITKDDFYTMTYTSDETKEKIKNIQEVGYEDDILFYYNSDRNIAWYYNALEDVEYFYK